MSTNRELAPESEWPPQEWSRDKYYEFVSRLAIQLSNATDADHEMYGFIWATIESIEPRDPLEAMLAAQMTAVHLSLMNFMRKFLVNRASCDQEIADRAMNKLARTFVMQMEALKRHRAGAEQKVTVQQVSVQEGGQAIVGNVTHTAVPPGPDEPSIAASPPESGERLEIAPDYPEVEAAAAEHKPKRRRSKTAHRVASAGTAENALQERMAIAEDEPEFVPAPRLVPEMPTIANPMKPKKAFEEPELEKAGSKLQAKR